MKKTAILILLVCIALPIFADDAMVLPAGVIRVSLVPNYGFVNGAYDNNGSYTAYPSGGGKVTAWDGGAAVEYGVTDWITAAVQWTPGWNFSSTYDTAIGTSSVNVNGLYALFIGAKMQFVGEKAPVTSESIRLCAALGVKAPLGGPNFQDQAANAGNGSAVTVAAIEKETLGLGARFYADCIFSPAFYLNLYSEFIYYPGTVAFKDLSLSSYGAYLLSGQTYNPDVGFGYDWTVELEPHYIYALSEGVHLEGSLPVTMTYSPDMTLGGTSQPNTSQLLISARPTLDLFLIKSPIPFPVEFKLAYSFPIDGWQTGASNAVIFIVRVYLKF